jgi:FkbM family methyltransferase
MITKHVPSIGNIIFKDDFSEEVWEFRHKKLSKFIDKNSVVLDIGAHIGNFTLLFASCKTKVIAFEPNPVVYNVLHENVNANISYNIIIYPFACTQETKTYQFNYSDPKIYGAGSNGGFLSNLQNNTFEKAHTYIQDVPGVNVLQFLNTHHKEDISKIQFIKIDAEGYDKEIIKTLIPLIEVNKPVLMVEAFKFLSQNEIQDYFNTIISLGYKIYDISPLDNIEDCSGPLSYSEFEYYIYNVCNNGNFLCVHKDQISKYNLPNTIERKTCAIIHGRNDDSINKTEFTMCIQLMLNIFDEIIYIDWNSDKTKKSLLYEIIKDIPKLQKIKHIIIEPQIANYLTQYNQNADLCNQVLSLNIGLRRTDAEYIVITTPHVKIPTESNLIDYIHKSNKNVLYQLWQKNVDLFNASAANLFNFQLATKNLWLKIKGYEEQMIYNGYVEFNLQKKALLYGFNIINTNDILLNYSSNIILKQNQLNNDINKWINQFDKYIQHDHIMISRNKDTWGFSDIEIEYEVI